MVYMYHSFLIHSSADGHLGCLTVLQWTLGTCVSFRSDFLGAYAQEWDCWVIWQFYFQFFFKEYPHCSPKYWCFGTVVLEKTLESSLDCKEIQPVHPKGDESWVFIGRTDVEAETPILWLPDAKRWLISKDPDAGKDWGQEEKGMTEDEMIGRNHQLNGHGFGWTLGVGDGQGGLACWTELNWKQIYCQLFLQQWWVYFISLENCSVGMDTMLAICKSLQSKAGRGEKEVWRDTGKSLLLCLSLSGFS